MNKKSKREIRTSFLCLIIILLCFQVFSVNSETLAHAPKSREIIVVLNTSVIEEIAEFKTNPCLQPDDFHLYSVKKHLLSLNIFCRALRAANYEFTINILPSPNFTRAIWLINKGEAHVFLHLLQKKTTKNTAADGIVYSDVLLKDNFRYSAFFTSVNNHDALTAKSLTDIQKLKAAVPQRWTWQQNKLKQLKVSYHEVLYKHLFMFIDKQRADVVLLDMKGKNPTERTLLGVKLKATGQIYFVGDKSERFALSKNIQGADELASALSVGLKKLKTAGIIDKVFSGLILDKTQLSGWQKYHNSKITTNK